MVTQRFKVVWPGLWRSALERARRRDAGRATTRRGRGASRPSAVPHLRGSCWCGWPDRECAGEGDPHAWELAAALVMGIRAARSHDHAPERWGSVGDATTQEVAENPPA